MGSEWSKNEHFWVKNVKNGHFCPFCDVVVPILVKNDHARHIEDLGPQTLKISPQMGPPAPKRDPLLGPSGGQKSHKTDDEAFLEFLVVRMIKNGKNGHFWLFLAIFVIFWTTFGPYLVEHINPYLVGEDYRITTGMICAEIARMIDPDAMAKFGQLPAISGMADRSSAGAMADYLLLAQELGFEQTDLHRICESLDYVMYVLKYKNGEGLVEDILGVSDENRFKKVTEFLSQLAKKNMKRQMETSLRHTHTNQLETGIQFNRVEIERGAYRYTYPAPGKTTSSIHDYFVERDGSPMITIGYGPDFAIIRSDGVDLNIPQMIEEIKVEIPEAGVSGGGHLVVGSMKFIPGEGARVREVLEIKIAETPKKN